MKDLKLITASIIGFGLLGLESADAARSASSGNQSGARTSQTSTTSLTTPTTTSTAPTTVSTAPTTVSPAPAAVAPTPNSINAPNSTGLQTAPTQPSSSAATSSTNQGVSQSTNVMNATQPGTTGELSQTELVTRVRQDLMNDPSLSSAAASITVENANGQITLRGSVPNQQTQQDLINRVGRMSGVNSVNNEISISK